MRTTTIRDDLFYARLAAWVETRRQLPFAWGGNDCTAFADSWVQQATGASALPELEPYATEEEAEALLAAHGGLEQAITNAMEAAGFQPCGVGHAQRGDVVMARIGNETPAGVCLGNEIAIAGPDGMIFAPRGCIIRAWAV